MYFEGIFATALGTIALVGLRIIERKAPRDVYRHITLLGEDRPDVETTLLPLLEQHHVTVVDLDYERDLLRKELSLRLVVRLKSGADLRTLVDQLGMQGFMKKVIVRSQRE